MAENELEVRLKKQISGLQGVVNSLSAQVQRLQRMVLHPSVLARIKSEVGGNLGDLLGTANQVYVTHGKNAVYRNDDVTLNLPQDIAISSTPIFTGVIPNNTQDDLGTVAKRWDVYAYDVLVENYLDWSGKPCKPKISIAGAEPNIGDNEFSFWQDSGTGTNYLLLDVAGVQTKIAISEPTWTSYAGTPVVGWAAGVSVEIWYQVLYGIIHVAYHITGTSNSVNTSFTLPYTVNSPVSWNVYNVLCADNSVWQTTPGLATMTGGSAVVTFYKDGALTLWTNVNNKTIAGEFFCKIV